ncbi:MAG TPA: CHAD domain-containing protein [Streptomyces sp.]|jgi:hypothetical protein|nr:CHAD domain-containing protein [Streptomyces sp.]
MGKGETVGRPARLVPAIRGGAHHGGGSTATVSVPAPPPVVRPAELETADAAELVSGYLHAWAADFLRSLRLHGESVGSAETATAAADAVRQLRRAARRLSGTLNTYRPLLDGVWADKLSLELRWLSDTLSREYGHAARLDRLHAALHRLASDGGGGEADGTPGSSSRGGSGTLSERPDSRRSGSGSPRGSGQDSLMPAGSARAGALLERQLTLARTRAHSAALQALVSARFHAVADAVALLSYEAPLVPQAAGGRAGTLLVPQAEAARGRLIQAVGALPLSRAEGLYHADTFARPVTARTSRLRQDAAWHEVRQLLRLHRYAEEVLLRAAGPPDGDADGAGDADGTSAVSRLASASSALDRHRDGAEAAEAAAAAARTPRIAPATAYALGVLHADQRQEVEAARLTFGRLWHQSAPQVL